MKIQFTHIHYLWLLIPALAWVIWLAWHTDAQLAPWRRRVAVGLRVVVLLLLLLGIAGLQLLRPIEGMNVLFLLDRSESIPSTQQEGARQYVNTAAGLKKKNDTAGVLVFGTDAAIENSPNAILDLRKIQAVVDTERTDLEAAIRLGTAAFPETGQKRMVLVSDGNENHGDALAALRSARSLGVTLDVAPLGAARAQDVLIQKMLLPGRIKKGQTFEAKMFIHAEEAREAILRLYRNNQPMAEQTVQLTPGKNLYTFSQTLNEPGFYSYTAQLEAPGDPVPQNNRATGFTHIRGDPKVLMISSTPMADETLAAALRSSRLTVTMAGIDRFPSTLAELQSFDSIVLCNMAAGDIGRDALRLLESAVRDFGVGLVCVGGDQAYAAGGYRGTPLEQMLPVSMDLDSKKVMPSGAVALVMHGMEFQNGNQVARECALGVLDALGPQDEFGVVLWDGNEKWLFPMQKVGDKRRLGREIAGMNQGDLPTFQGVMSMAHEGLKKSSANLKHMIVFSDGDPGAPTLDLMHKIVADRITVTTVLIAGHAGPETMIMIADQGRGRFYNINDPSELPQIFLKETAVILKSAIFEEPFTPQLATASELLGGFGSKDFPQLLGYVCTTAKPRAETPLLTEKGDPLLAHWHYGLGRAVAFTSDAKAKWAQNWIGWPKYRQFWSQAVLWSVRRVENAEFTAEVNLDQAEGHLSVEALDPQGNYRNFLRLQAIVASPKGQTVTLPLDQTGPGRYEVKFPTREVGAYLINVAELRDGQIAASQVVGGSINYSPEFTTSGPNVNFLRTLAQAGGGRLLDPSKPADNPFLHDRTPTYRPEDLWELLLRLAVILFVVDVGLRRIQLGPEEWAKMWAVLRRTFLFWRRQPAAATTDESLATLLARRDQVRARHGTLVPSPAPELFEPTRPSAAPVIAQPASEPPKGSAQPPTTPEPPQPEGGSTASRLLEAKRRAQKKR